MAVNIISDKERHDHAVNERAGGADGHQRVHVGIAVEQRLEAVDKEIPSAVQHRDSQQQL